MEATEIEYDSRRRNPSLRTAPSGPRYFLAVSVNEPNPPTMATCSSPGISGGTIHAAMESGAGVAGHDLECRGHLLTIDGE